MEAKTDIFEAVHALVEAQEARTGSLPEQAWKGEVTKALKVDLYDAEVTVFQHTPSYVAPRGIVIDLRGSGFVHSRTVFDGYFCHRLCVSSGYIVLGLEYPLAPEMPFPAALNCTYWFMQKVLADPSAYGGHVGMPIAVLGHSAGGNLAVGAQVLALRAEERTADIVLLDYPVLDLDTPPGKKPHHGDSQGTIPVEHAELFNEAYRRKVPLGNDLVSPILLAEQDFVGFPPTVIHTASSDSLAPEAATFAANMRAGGGAVRLKEYGNSGHGFTVDMTGKYQESFDDFLHDMSEVNEVVEEREEA